MRQFLACLFLPDEVDTAIARLQLELAEYEPLLPRHLTLAPPKQEGFPEEELRAACQRVAPLDLTIGPVDTFLPAEPVIYFAVSGPGLAGLRELRQVFGLNDEYVPHVTLVRHIPHEILMRCFEAAQGLSWEVCIEEVKVLDMSRDDDKWTWSVREILRLGHAAVS